MAASVRMRPSLLKNLYFNRSTCILCRQCQSTTSSSVVQSEKGVGENPLGHIDSTDIPRGQINIPKKKKRDSLSILKALASTVGRDPTAPSYHIMDDPRLIPRGKHSQNLVLLSKASGKRTARFMVNEYKNTFNTDAAVPHVKAFQPDFTEYKHIDASPEALEERISYREVNDAVEIYNKMTEEGIEVSPELKLSFLELLCVFGCKNAKPNLMSEERIIGELEVPDENPSKIGMDLADDVFQTLPEKTVDAYNWIVRGLLKYQDTRGLLYYKEMKDSKLPVYLGTYNELLCQVGMQKDNKWQTITKYLKEMKKNGMSPNQDTFHSILRAMKWTPGSTLSKNVPSVLAEMKVLNIEPTLQTWSLVLSALCSDGMEADRQSFKEGHGIMSDIVEIIQHIRKNIDQAYTDHTSENFLVKAMSECRRYRDTEVAIMLYQLKEDMGHRYLITNLTDEHRFYENLLLLISMTETPDRMMEIYNKVCPSLHVASFQCLKVMIQNLEMYREYEHILQLWQDSKLVLRKRALDYSTMYKFLEVFGNALVPPEMGKHFVQIARKIYDDRMKTTDLAVDDSQLLRHLILIFINNQELDDAWNAMMYFYSNEVVGFLRYDLLTNVLEMSIKQRDAHKIMSFCDIPDDARASMIKTANKVLAENETELRECLDEAQLEMLQKAFEEQ